MSESAISVSELSHTFVDPGRRGNVEALIDVDLEVERGRFMAIIGPSGCGKTTLFNIIAGLHKPSVGGVLVHGVPPKVGDPKVGYLFARDALLPWRTAHDNVELGMEFLDIGRRERRKRAEEMLASVGLASQGNAYPAQLSQGMRQRVAIARTLATEPQLLLMDEPFSALDAQTRLVAQDVFIQLWQRLSATVVLITHDLNEAVALSDSVAVMSRSPGSITRLIDIDLPRPRRIADVQSDPRFHELYADIWTSLRDEFYSDAGIPESGESVQTGGSV